MEPQRSRALIRLLAIGRVAWKSFGYLVLCLGFVTGYFALLPKVAIVQSEPLDQDVPFSAPFIVSNDGPLAVNSVVAQCLLLDIEGPNLNLNHTLLQNPTLTKERLEVGERAVITCTLPVYPQHLTKGDIAIRVTVRPDWTFWKITRTYRFIALNDPSGRSHWFPEAMSPRRLK